MAGELKGKLYEAILKLVLSNIFARSSATNKIFWETVPDGMSIKPDFTVGPNADQPKLTFLVSHGGSVNESNRKYWRNCGELVETKLFLKSTPRVISIYFDAHIKEDIKLAEKATFDASLIVGDQEYGDRLIRWVDDNIAGYPKSKEECVEMVEEDIKQSPALKELIQALTNDLKRAIESVKSGPGDLIWAAMRTRTQGRAPRARNTSVKRGLAKALLLGHMPSSKRLAKAETWMEDLGLVSKCVGGWMIADDDLRWISEFGLSWSAIQSICKEYSTEGFLEQVDKVRNLAMLDPFMDYVETYYNELVSHQGMMRHLKQQNANPAHSLKLEGVTKPNNIWLFDFIGALSKAISGKSQSFGYSNFHKHPQCKKTKIGSMNIGNWCGCFMNQFFSRKSGFPPPTAAVEYVALVLADELRSISKNAIKSSKEKIKEFYIGKEYNAVLLSHRGFDPLLALLEKYLPNASEVSIRSCFGEYGGLTGQSVKTGLVKVDRTLIKCQSVTDQGRDHKKKELCGRAVALRYSWDAKRKKFIPRPEVEKLILVVDGTWRREDLLALARAGWDEIFYPDEMDKLAAAIV